MNSAPAMYLPARARMLYQPQKPSDMQYWTLVVILVAFSLVGGYTAGIQPAGEWRFFSWHPFLMTSGMVALAGVGAVTKKMGGYANTKVSREFARFVSVCLLPCFSRV